MRVLLIGFSFGVPYRVLRCSAALGLEVFVLGGREARHLARSRFCAGFTGLPEGPGVSLDFLLAETARCLARHRIDMVLPADHEAFRVLSLVRGRIAARVFPMPDPAAFDTLDDKFRFSRHCLRLGVPHPPTILVRDPRQLRRACLRAGLQPPLLIKPTRMSGSQGVTLIARAQDFARLDDRFEGPGYRPLLVQQFAPGEDACATVFARRGRVVVGQTYRRRHGRVDFDANHILLHHCRRLIEPLGIDGVVNFDARVGPGGIHLIECNPRFFYSMDYAAVAGVNFVALGLGRRFTAAELARPQRPMSLAAPVRSLRRLACLARPSADDLAMLRHFLADPLPPLLAEEIPWRSKKLFDGKAAALPTEMVRLPASLRTRSAV